MKKGSSICLLLIIIILLVTYLKFLWDTKQQISLDLNYQESTNTLWNPERGWYSIYACKVNDDVESGKSFYSQFVDQYNAGDSLVLLLFNLKGYREGDISNQGLGYINNVLDSAQQSGLKTIVRFVYDWDGYAIESEPENISIILRHMEQLKYPMSAHENSIYLVQGIFIGNHGEMHNSNYLKNEDVAILMNKLLECTPDKIKISVRTPALWRLICDRNEPISNLRQYPGARIGLYNDGLCSSETDLGTYSDGTGYVAKWSRLDELKFQSELCRFVPNGGEFALESEYNDLHNIIKEFPQLHISYLNRNYNTDVLEKLKNTIYLDKYKQNPYNGVNGYKYIEDHLGFRFVLRNVSINRRCFLNINSTMEIEVENTGFANMYFNKKITLLLEGENSNNTISIPVDTDIRTWESGEVTKIKILIPTDNLQEDTYKVYLKITDDEENGIQMANANIYNHAFKGNAIGEIQTELLSFLNIWK